MPDWYTVAERWHWSPDAIESLAVEDLFDHADIARGLFEKEAKANARPQGTGKRRQSYSLAP